MLETIFFEEAAKVPFDDAAGRRDDNSFSGKLRDFFGEANELGKAGALRLNAQLEDAGVLPPVAPGAASGGQDAAASASDAAPASEVEAPSYASATKGSSKGGKKTKKKKKRR